MQDLQYHYKEKYFQLLKWLQVLLELQIGFDLILNIFQKSLDQTLLQATSLE